MSVDEVKEMSVDEVREMSVDEVVREMCLDKLYR